MINFFFCNISEVLKNFTLSRSNDSSIIKFFCLYIIKFYSKNTQNFMITRKLLKVKI